VALVVWSELEIQTLILGYEEKRKKRKGKILMIILVAFANFCPFQKLDNSKKRKL